MVVESAVRTASRTLNRLLQPLGLQISRRRNIAEHNELIAALVRLRNRGVSPATVLDLGASDGRWSRIAHEIFPSAHALGFEPLAERHSDLQALAEEAWFDFVPAAVGAEEGTVILDVGTDLDGSGVYDAPAHPRAVPLITLDAELARRQISGPFLLKLDTHGFEIPVLAGAEATLNNTVAACIEAYNFRLSEPSVRFHELIAKMEELGFRCYDIIDLLRRPRDEVLWQADFIFLRADAKWFGHTNFR